AHAASIVLARVAGVLRVLVTASTDTRVERLVAGRGMTVDAARAAIPDSDSERRSYFRDFYKVPEGLPTHYDLVPNTEALAPALAVTLILAAAKGLPEG